MKSDKKKHKINIVYSTNSSFQYEYDGAKEDETLPPGKQELRVMIDRKNRGGKTVTLVTGFKGKKDDLDDLGRLLKSKCGTGGSVKDNEIIIQGDFRDKVMEILTSSGYHAKKSGG
ncbi:MAG: translation initiation factor [Bacteroidia bacterium]|nr:translation initiation factor [Bacteroidia bacterium]